MKNLIWLVIFGVLLQAPLTAVGAEKYVLISSPLGHGSGNTLTRQLAGWEQSGSIADAQLFRSEPEEAPQFEMLGIVRFADAEALQAWHQSLSPQLPDGIAVTEVEVLANLGASGESSADSVFQIMQYAVHVDRASFDGYIEGYQLAEMRVREQSGALLRYTSYFAGPGATVPWQSLIIMEHKDADTFANIKEVNKALGEKLALEDERFNSYKKTKDSIRTKTAVSQASWVSLSITDSGE